MEKIETLLNRDLGRPMDTPKKVNRSAREIPAQTISSLEDGEFTAEMIETLAKQFPIFYYRSCITIHGNWPAIEITRIGGYKNVHQNANGSVEIYYSAIDNTKMNTICEGLRGTQTPFHFSQTSTDRTFRWQKMITKETLAQVRAEMEPLAQQLTNLPIYGYVNLWVARVPWGATYLVLDLHPLAIKTEDVDKVISILSMCTPTQYVERRANYLQEQIKEESARQARSAQYTAEAKAAREQQKAMLDALKPQIAHLPESNDVKVGILVKAASNVGESTAWFTFVRLDGNGSFGRVKISTARSDRPSLDGLEWKERKQMTREELRLHGYRVIQAAQRRAA